MQTQQACPQNIQTPLVSFIITTYNLPTEYLKACLDSVLSVSLSADEREIIIVDDGSALSPLNDLRDYHDDFIYLRQANQGLSIARNHGLQIATGEYIQFVDGDDYLLKFAYNHCLDIVRHHDPDIVYFYLANKDEKEASAHSYACSKPISGCMYLQKYNLRASACGYVFKKNILHSIRFTPGILHEDEEFTPMLFLKAERIITTDAKAYFYRTRQDSIMHQTENMSHNLKRLADIELVIVHLQQKAASMSEHEREALGRRVAQLTMDYLYNTILLTRSTRYLEEAIGRLHEKGLYPLPNENYTKKYQLFNMAIRSKLGRKLMMLTFPIFRK